jgi:hypothetical protein
MQNQYSGRQPERLKMKKEINTQHVILDGEFPCLQACELREVLAGGKSKLFKVCTNKLSYILVPDYRRFYLRNSHIL